MKDAGNHLTIIGSQNANSYPVQEKNHRYCFECNDFPCEKLEESSSDGNAHHRRTVENMKTMKEIGLDAWIKDQKKKDPCVFCP